MPLLIAANWKMHKTGDETADFCTGLRALEERFAWVEILLCPPFTALASARAALKGSSIRLGAQNMHWEQKGAFTGEIAAPMLLSLEVSHVLIGHSERRQLMGETDEAVRRKVRAALQAGLTPLLCVGETEQERRRGHTAAVLRRQLTFALSELDAGTAQNLVVAYEPVWAIGTGVAASAGDADRAAKLVREVTGEILGPAAAGQLRLLYGGSVSAANIGQFVAQPSVDGALVGGASLELEPFVLLINSAREAVGL